jgi:acetyl-CoA carboxylase biotin carboxyl carrier protein
MKLDLDQLDALLTKLAAHDVSEFEWEDESASLRVTLGKPVHHVMAAPVHHVAAAPSAAPAHAAAKAEPGAPATVEGTIVTSPFVGTFYRAPNPESPAFCEVGATVKKGQTLCIVEAMKLMNEIEADVAGTVAEIYAENGKPVEYGQRLFRILPA